MAKVSTILSTDVVFVVEWKDVFAGRFDVIQYDAAFGWRSMESCTLDQRNGWGYAFSWDKEAAPCGSL